MYIQWNILEHTAPSYNAQSKEATEKYNLTDRKRFSNNKYDEEIQRISLNFYIRIFNNIIY